MLIRITEEMLFLYISYTFNTATVHNFYISIAGFVLKKHFVSQQDRDFLLGVYLGDDSRDEALMRELDNYD